MVVINILSILKGYSRVLDFSQQIGVKTYGATFNTNLMFNIPHDWILLGAWGFQKVLLKLGCQNVVSINVFNSTILESS